MTAADAPTIPSASATSPADAPADPVSGHGADPSPLRPSARGGGEPGRPASPPRIRSGVAGAGSQASGPRRRPAAKLGPYSQLRQRLDKRTRAGRRAAAFEQALIAQLGGAPSAAESALIKLAVTLDCHIELMRARLLATEAGDERAERHMLAWCNSLSKTLRTLGLKAAPRRPPTLAEIVAGFGADGGA